MANNNQYIFILGVSSGFGAAVARKLAHEGYHIIGVHLDRAAGIRQVEQLSVDCREAGVRTLFFNMNAADAENRRKIMAGIEAEFAMHQGSNIKLLLHSLAFGTLKPFVSPDPETLTQRNLEMTLDVMANSFVYYTQDVVSSGLMHSGGRIIGLTSAGSNRVLPAYGAVSAAKAALESYCRQLALELSPYSITVNTIRAGVTLTPALAKIPGSDIIISNAVMRNPHHRLTEPNDVANVVSLLIKDEASWINGTIVGVDGGEDSTDLTWWKPTTESVSSDHIS